MTYTMTADRIIDLADRLGFGIDLDFTGRKPIIIQPLDGRPKKFVTMDDALVYLETRMKNLMNMGAIR